VQDKAALALAANRGVTADVLKKEGFSKKVSDMLAPEWASFPKLNGKSYHNQPVKSFSSLQNVYNQSLSATVTPQTTQAVAQQRQQQIAQVSQPVQTQPQVNYIPIDMSGGGKQTQQSSSSGEGISAPPPTSQSGPTVPFLSSSNSDNFLVLYSRMIYNLVDG
jgi:hypothetical protein